MPFALLIVGVFLLVTSVRNKQDDLFKLLQSDFTGQGNFWYWAVSILLIGAIGYVPKLKPLSDSFLVLVIVVLFLAKGDPNRAGGNFFSSFTNQLGTTAQPSGVAATPQYTNNGTFTVGTPNGPTSIVPGSANSADWLKNLGNVTGSIQ